MSHNKTFYKIITDVVVAISTVLLISERATGTTIHEWLGVAGLAAVVTHLLLSFDWFAAVTKRFFQKQTFQVRLNWTLSAALFIAMTAAFYSGLVISKVVMPALGITLADGFAWKSIHSLSSNITLFITALHLAVNWKWVVKHIIAPFQRQPRKAAEQPATALSAR
jgi:cellobiose-specific phosphotransferase system component IIC